jgi:hypothetical protein
MPITLSWLHPYKLLGITKQSKNQAQISMLHVVQRVQFLKLYVSEPEPVSVRRCKGGKLRTQLSQLERENLDYWDRREGLGQLKIERTHRESNPFTSSL